jgi:hypothetical protein
MQIRHKRQPNNQIPIWDINDDVDVIDNPPSTKYIWFVCIYVALNLLMTYYIMVTCEDILCIQNTEIMTTAMLTSLKLNMYLNNPIVFALSLFIHLFQKRVRLLIYRCLVFIQLTANMLAVYTFNEFVGFKIIRTQFDGIVLTDRTSGRVYVGLCIIDICITLITISVVMYNTNIVRKQKEHKRNIEQIGIIV